MGLCFSAEQNRSAPYAAVSGKGTEQQFTQIRDNYETIEQVQEALRNAGLESSNLILGLDFTGSNEHAGKRTFGGRGLHHLSEVPNPYQEAIAAIGETLSAFDDDNLIPAYGFGDDKTEDHSIFSFLPSDAPCNGLDHVLQRYREITPHVKLSGPTSFAPIINHAAKVVAQSGGQYHILLLVADGQVTTSCRGSSKSSQEEATIKAIVEASRLPLSIVMVGVGDGPWDLMEEFDDKLPKRAFDNFQFVNFSEVASRYPPGDARDAAFALHALMEIPDQFRAIQRLGLLGASGKAPQSYPPLDPPASSIL